MAVSRFALLYLFSVLTRSKLIKFIFPAFFSSSIFRQEFRVVSIAALGSSVSQSVFSTTISELSSFTAAADGVGVDRSEEVAMKAPTLHATAIQDALALLKGVCILWHAATVLIFDTATGTPIESGEAVAVPSAKDALLSAVIGGDFSSHFARFSSLWQGQSSSSSSGSNGSASSEVGTSFERCLATVEAKLKAAAVAAGLDGVICALNTDAAVEREQPGGTSGTPCTGASSPAPPALACLHSGYQVSYYCHAILLLSTWEAQDLSRSDVGKAREAADLLESLRVEVGAVRGVLGGLQKTLNAASRAVDTANEGSEGDKLMILAAVVSARNLLRRCLDPNHHGRDNATGATDPFATLRQNLSTVREAGGILKQIDELDSVLTTTTSRSSLSSSSPLSASMVDIVDGAGVLWQWLSEQPPTQPDSTYTSSVSGSALIKLAPAWSRRVQPMQRKVVGWDGSDALIENLRVRADSAEAELARRQDELKAALTRSDELAIRLKSAAATASTVAAEDDKKSKDELKVCDFCPRAISQLLQFLKPCSRVVLIDCVFFFVGFFQLILDCSYHCSVVLNFHVPADFCQMLHEAYQKMEEKQLELEKENRALKSGILKSAPQGAGGQSKGVGAASSSTMSSALPTGAGVEGAGGSYGFAEATGPAGFSGLGQRGHHILEVQGRLLRSWRSLATRRLLRHMQPLPLPPCMLKQEATAISATDTRDYLAPVHPITDPSDGTNSDNRGCGSGGAWSEGVGVTSRESQILRVYR